MEAFLHSGMHWKIINFVIFVGLLAYFLKNPLKEFWKSRCENIKSSLEEAQKLHHEAKELSDQLQKRFNHVEEEVSKLIRQLEEEGEAGKKRILEESEKLSQRIQLDAERIASHEVLRARETLKAEATQLSLDLAEKLIREKINSEDQKKLIREYVQEIEKGVSL